MVIDELLRYRRVDILRIAQAHGAVLVRVFGSMSRGTAHQGSDIDLLIDLQPGRHLLDLVAIKQDLEDLLGREVHVVAEAAISPYMRERVLRDASPL